MKSTLLTPESFEQAVVLFVIPLGILVLSWLIQHHFRARLNAGIEFFAFLVALDLAYLAHGDHGIPRINPQFTAVYRPMFTFLLVLSLCFMGWAARVQALIYEHISHRAQYYPAGRVFFCWLFALAAIDCHVVITLGGGN